MLPVHQSPIRREVVHPYMSSSGLYHISGGHAFSHLSAGGLVIVSINHWPPSLCRPHPSGSTTLRTASRPHVLDNNATVVAPCTCNWARTKSRNFGPCAQRNLPRACPKRRPCSKGFSASVCPLDATSRAPTDIRAIVRCRRSAGNSARIANYQSAGTVGGNSGIMTRSLLFLMMEQSI